MNEFTKALISQGKNNKIPDDQNIFGALIDEWDFEWIDNHGKDLERHVKGEWIFSWILEGTAIQDLFICPSREERASNKQPDAEYGTTIRIYNPCKQTWDIFYGNIGEATRLEAKKEGNQIVLTEITEQKMKWIFSNLTDHSFHWQRIEMSEKNEWKLIGELFAIRKK